jgi:uncharacterized sulfatase
VQTKQWKYIRNLHPEFQHSTHTNRDGAAAAYQYWLTWERAAASDPKARAIVEAFKRRPAEELYDLRQDPDERQNVVADPRHAKQLARLRALLDAWMEDTGDASKVYGNPLPHDAEAFPLRKPAPAK